MTRHAQQSMSRRTLMAAGALAAALATASHSRDAEACGCFTPPDPSVPVVQAGERILFSIDNGTVTAHIQIQYAGNAAEFGWLLPLPNIAADFKLELGTDELFTRLIGNTQPKYRLVTNYDGSCGFRPFTPTTAPGASAGGTGSGGAGGVNDGRSVVVIQDSVGPYDYAVLHADSQDEMLGWMADNHYFVPAGTAETVGAYIRPGAYFLALKLRSGQSAGDLQPVVVRYPSELPMIPIVLTSVAAQPNMGVQVWMLGAGRAIPRNYYHTVINDMAIDWTNAGQNYNDVIIKAVGEAPGKHSFVTEFAGASTIMQKTLNYAGRYGTQAELAAAPDAPSFVEYLLGHGAAFSSQLTAILGRYIPYPAALATQGITATAFYQNLRYFLDTYRPQNPSLFEGWALDYQPVPMAQEIQDRIVKPTLDAGALFDKYPYLTRLYTTLSPQDMTLDPVFSFNRTLPDVAKDHQATLTYYCGVGSNDAASTPARLVTEQGWIRDFPQGTGLGVQTVPAPPGGLAARRLETLTEENSTTIMDNPPPSGCGCDIGGGRGASAVALTGGAFILSAASVLVRRRRRRAERA